MFKISHNKLLPWLAYLVGIIFIGGLILAVTTIWIFWQYGRDLPDYRQLSNYSPPVTTRVHAGDGSLLAEYAIEKRSFVPVSSIPKQLIHAFLSAEDKNYYQHPGIDAFGVLRALLTNVRNYGKGRKNDFITRPYLKGSKGEIKSCTTIRTRNTIPSPNSLA